MQNSFKKVSIRTIILVLIGLISLITITIGPKRHTLYPLVLDEADYRDSLSSNISRITSYDDNKVRFLESQELVTNNVSRYFFSSGQSENHLKYVELVQGKSGLGPWSLRFLVDSCCVFQPPRSCAENIIQPNFISQDERNVHSRFEFKFGRELSGQTGEWTIRGYNSRWFYWLLPEYIIQIVDFLAMG